MNLISIIIYFLIFLITTSILYLVSPAIEYQEEKKEAIQVVIIAPTATPYRKLIPTKVTQANFNKIQLGMTLKAVIEFLGEPTNKLKQFAVLGDTYTSLEFVNKNESTEKAIIDFTNGKVSSMYAVGLN